MRPRVFPAEDVVGDVPAVVLVFSASMRPRVFPAEDQHLGRIQIDHVHASMRPRVFPAEDPGAG